MGDQVMMRLPRIFLRKAALSREGIIGLGLFMLCLSLYLSTVRPAQLQLDQLHVDVASLQKKVGNSTHPPLTQGTTPAEQLDAYYNFFPAQTTTPEWLERIYTAASNQGIRIKEGEYRASRERTGKLIRYQITMPVSGTYLQLRKFLAQVLSDIPIASLDHISFERQRIGEAVITAEIKLSLYLEQQP